MVACHVTRFRAAFCNPSVGTEKVFSDAFSVSLYLFFWPPMCPFPGSALQSRAALEDGNLPCVQRARAIEVELFWGGLQCRAFLCCGGFPDLVCVHPIQRTESCVDSVDGTASAFLCDACSRSKSHTHTKKTRVQLPCRHPALCSLWYHVLDRRVWRRSKAWLSFERRFRTSSSRLAAELMELPRYLKTSTLFRASPSMVMFGGQSGVWGQLPEQSSLCWL